MFTALLCLATKEVEKWTSRVKLSLWGIKGTFLTFFMFLAFEVISCYERFSKGEDNTILTNDLLRAQSPVR